MEYGMIPVIYRLVEGGNVKPPIHVDALFPTRAVQFIRVFSDSQSALRFVKEFSAEDYVDFIDNPKNIREFFKNKTGMTMVLHVN